MSWRASSTTQGSGMTTESKRQTKNANGHKSIITPLSFSCVAEMDAVFMAAVTAAASSASIDGLGGTTAAGPDDDDDDDNDDNDSAFTTATLVVDLDWTLSLSNTHSNYNSVIKTILMIHQNFSSNHTSKCSLIHHTQYYAMITTLITRLSFCSIQHHDRRCRLLALRTISGVTLTALSSLYGYSRTPPTPTPTRRCTSDKECSTVVGDSSDLYVALYSSSHDFITTTCKRFEDDIVHHIVADTLIPLILQEEDELVCTCALQTLGILLQNGIFSLQERTYSISFHKHVLAMCNPCSFITSFSTTVLSSTYNSSYTSSSSSSHFLPNLFNPLQLLATRIMDSVLLPRMKQILHRISLLKTTTIQTVHHPTYLSNGCRNTSSSNNISTLSKLLLTPVLTYLFQTEYVRKCQLQHTQSSLAKRANEFNTPNWIQEYIHSILIPLLDKPCFSISSHVKYWFSSSSSSSLADASTTSTTAGQQQSNIPPKSSSSSQNPPKSRLELLLPTSHLEDESVTSKTTSSNNSSTVTFPIASSISSSSTSSMQSMVQLVSTALVSDIDFTAVHAAIDLCVAFSTSYKQPWVDSLILQVIGHLLSSPLTHVVSHPKFPYGSEYQINSDWMKDMRHICLVDDEGETLQQWMALLLFSIRGLSLLGDKLYSLILVSKLLLLGTLPSLASESNPHGKESIDLALLDGTWIRPVRLGYWMEIAMTLILSDDCNKNKQTTNNLYGKNTPSNDDKCLILTKYFSSLEEYIAVKKSPLASSENDDVINILMEMVLVFCSVCCIHGEWLCINRESRKTSIDTSTDEKQELYSWLSCSLVILTKLSFYLHVEGSGDSHRKVGISVESGAQIMFARLFRMVLQSTGYLTIGSSIYLAHVASVYDFFHIAPICEIINQQYGSIIEEKITSILDLTINQLLSDNPLINCLELIAIVIDAWTFQFQATDFNDISIAKMEHQAMILLRQLTNAMFTLRRTDSKDLILAVICVEKIAVSISRWSENKTSINVHLDSMELMQNLLVICLRTITVDDTFKLLFSDTIQRIHSLVHEKHEITDQVIVDDQYKVSFDVSSLNESSFDIRFTTYCTIALAKTNFYKRRITTEASSSGKEAFEIDSIPDSVQESYDEGYIFEIYKQLIIDRCLFFLSSTSNRSSSFQGTSRSFDPFQVAYPLISSQHCEHNLSLWPGSVVAVTGSSDPITVTCGYAPERSIMDDGTTYWALKVILKVFNNTTASIPRGIQVTLQVVSPQISLIDDYRSNYYDREAVQHHRQEIKAGETLTFSVVFDSFPFGIYTLIPCITFCGIKTEYVTRGYLKEDNRTDSLQTLDDNDAYEYLDLMLHCSPVTTSIFLSLRPNPLVFFRDAFGDESTFNFLWSSCAHGTAFDKPISSPSSYLLDGEENIIGFQRNAPDNLLRSAEVKMYREKEQVSFYAWAFKTWCGNHLLIKFHTSKDGDDGLQLQFRSDNSAIIQILTYIEEARREIIHMLSSHVANNYH